MNVCTTGNFRVLPCSSCTHTAVATGNVMLLFMALNQVVLCSLFPVQQTTSGIGHRVKYLLAVFFGLATNTLNVRNNNNSNNKLMYHKKCYVSFHGAQGACTAVLQETNTKFTEPEGAPRFLWSVMSEPTSRLSLLLSATCGTAYDALMSPLFSGASQILKSSKNFENNGSKPQGPR